MKMIIEDSIGFRKQFDPKIIPLPGDEILFSGNNAVVEKRQLIYDEVGNLEIVVVSVKKIS